jgi:hypothetical protein
LRNSHNGFPVVKVVDGQPRLVGFILRKNLRVLLKLKMFAAAEDDLPPRVEVVRAFEAMQRLHRSKEAAEEERDYSHGELGMFVHLEPCEGGGGVADGL